MIRTSPSETSASSAGDTGGPLHVLWIGDSTLARRFVARRAPYVHVTSSDCAGALDLLATQKAPADKTLDLIVIDTAAPGCNPLQVLSTAGVEGIDLPAILLVEPGDDDWTTRGGRLTVCDSLVKTQDFLHQLLPTIAQVRLRHEATLQLRSVRRSEQHYKSIVEGQPHTVCMIDMEGSITTINQAGLRLLDARPDAVLGAAFADFLTDEDRGRVVSALGNARVGEPATLQHQVRRGDGPPRSVQTEVVPFSGVDGGSTLLVITESWVVDAAMSASPTGAGNELERIAQLERARSEATEQAKAAEARLAKATAEYERQTSAFEILLDEARTMQEAAKSECARLQESLRQADEERRVLTESLRRESDESGHEPQSDDAQRPTAEIQQVPPARDDEAASERLALQLQAAEARCLALTATVAQLAEQAQASRVAEADATAILASRCRQLSDELASAKASSAESDERFRSVAEELASAKAEKLDREERLRLISDELATAKASHLENDERLRLATETAARDRARAQALAERLAEDHRDFADIRQEFLRFLVTAEDRCESLASRGAAALAGFAQAQSENAASTGEASASATAEHDTSAEPAA